MFYTSLQNHWNEFLKDDTFEDVIARANNLDEKKYIRPNRKNS